MIKIEKVNNGWLLTNSVKPESTTMYVFQEKNDYLYEKASIEAFSNLLRKVNDLIGPSDKYLEHEILIDVKSKNTDNKHDDEIFDNVAVS